MSNLTFRLSKRNPSKTFILKDRSSVIRIDKMVVNHLDEEQLNKWIEFEKDYSIIDASRREWQFVFTNSKEGRIYRSDFLELRTVFCCDKKLEFSFTKLIVPPKNVNNWTDDYLSDVTIEIVSKQGELEEDFDADVKCSIFNGVSEAS